MYFSKSKSVRMLIVLGMLLPALLFVVGTFIAGLVISGMQSMDYFPLIGKTGFSFHVYQQLFGSAVFYHALLFSFGISLLATGAAAAIAVTVALWLRRHADRGGLLYFMLKFNLPVPHVVGALAVLMMLGQSGFAARITYALGVIHEPSQFPVIVGDQSGIGIVLEYVWKEVPFIAVSVLSVLKSWIIPYEKQIQLLGASPWQRLRYVTLPFVMPPLLASSIIVFAYTFGSFEVPYVLGSVSQPTLPVLAYQAYLNPDLSYRAEAMAINMVITIIGIGLILLYMKWGEAYAPPRR